MSVFDTMLARNQEFAAQVSSAGTPMPSLPESLPGVKALIITCADMRVDPAHVLGVELGEAVVMRNIGGRITPDLIEQIGMLGRIGQVAGETPGGGGEFHIVILQHTDCGITRLAGDPAMLAHYFQIPESEVAAKTVLDPRNAVAMDVASLRAITALPASWMISGINYDVTTGLAEVVVPPAPLRTAWVYLHTQEIAPLLRVPSGMSKLSPNVYRVNVLNCRKIANPLIEEIGNGKLAYRQ